MSSLSLPPPEKTCCFVVGQEASALGARHNRGTEMSAMKQSHVFTPRGGSSAELKGRVRLRGNPGSGGVGMAARAVTGGQGPFLCPIVTSSPRVSGISL